MNRDKRSRRHSSNWKNGSRRTEEPQPVRRQFRPPKAVTQEQIRETEAAIRAFKETHQPVCARCGVPIVDMSTAMTDRQGGGAIHFDCALEAISRQETLDAGDRIAYIGQGRFGIITYPNAHDTRHFTIKKIIEWEEKDQEIPWRDEMAEMYSKVR